MTKMRLAVVALLAGVLLMSTGSLAVAATPAYPVATPTPDGGGGSNDPGQGDAAPDDDRAPNGTGAGQDADRADDNGVLPGTGGASIYVLLAAGVLLAVGGSIVYSTRRPGLS
jgi:LPXTG-motif cell wall-anchored protein